LLLITSNSSGPFLNVRPEKERLFMGQMNTEYTDKWLAYFDYLGFRRRIEVLPAGGVLEDFWEALSQISLEERYEHVRVHKKRASDTLIFYGDDDSRDSFSSVEGSATDFFRSMFLRRIPLRGCLAVGKLYIDEENDIYFGPAFIEAHDTAEGQDWVGFVLTKSARDRISRYRVDGISALDVCMRYRYNEYRVPFKPHGLKDKISSLFRKVFRCRMGRQPVLPAYTMNIRPSSGNARSSDSIRLWNALIEMQDIARDIYCKKKKESREVNVKYENTKNFLLEILPELKELAKDRNRQIDPGVMPTSSGDGRRDCSTRRGLSGRERRGGSAPGQWCGRGSPPGTQGNH